MANTFGDSIKFVARTLSRERNIELRPDRPDGQCLCRLVSLADSIDGEIAERDSEISSLKAEIKKLKDAR